MDKIIKEIASKALNVNEDEVVILDRLMGGRSNYMYKFKVNEKMYTFRIPGKNAFQFVDRSIEQANIERIKPLELNANTIYFDVETGYKIAEYIDGFPLDTVHDINIYIQDVANILRNLHHSEIKAINDYNPFDRLTHYESINKELDYVYSPHYFEVKDRLLTYKDYLLSQPQVLCHGDSQLANFILDQNNKIYLLDWEFTGNNDYVYDIACYGNNDINDALKIFEVYLGRKPMKEELKRLYLWRSFQAMQWHSVAMYKHLIGLSDELHVDFLTVSKKYLQLAESLLDYVKEELE